MSAFELKKDEDRSFDCDKDVKHAHDRLRQECIIALKVYDSCRQPQCKVLQHYKIIQNKKP